MRAFVAILFLGAAVSTDAPDPDGWSRFRGPIGSGVSESRRLPTEFGPLVSARAVLRAQVDARRQR